MSNHTERILLTAAELDTLLLAADAEERAEDIESLIRLDETTRENARWAAQDAEEEDRIIRWATERQDEADTLAALEEQ